MLKKLVKENKDRAVEKMKHRIIHRDCTGKKRQIAELKSFSGQEINRSLQMQGCRCFIRQQAMW